MDLGDDIIAPRSVSMVGRNINCKCANGLSDRHNYGLDRSHLGAPNLPLPSCAREFGRGRISGNTALSKPSEEPSPRESDQ